MPEPNATRHAMRKTQVDIDAIEILRRSAESTPGTLSTYLALREIATACDSAEFYTNVEEIRSRSLTSERWCRRNLNLMERKRLLDKSKSAMGLKIRLLKVAKA